MRVILRVFVVITLILSSILFYTLTPFPIKDNISLKHDKAFSIKNDNEIFENQPPSKCAAYSLAYVIRNFGNKAFGDSLYEELDYKIPLSGYVLPKGITTYTEKLGYTSKVYKGNLDTLKARLSEGKPIIVLIGDSIKWQHYMTLVGYDENKKELYFYDSKKTSDNNTDKPGNRTLTEDYFIDLWDNDLPVFNHLYIAIDK